MYYIVDRFEEDTAVIELPDKSTVPVPARILPPGTKEGDVISVALDPDATSRRRGAARRRAIRTRFFLLPDAVHPVCFFCANFIDFSHAGCIILPGIPYCFPYGPFDKVLNQPQAVR